MNELSALEVVDVWERGRNRDLAGRAVELLAVGGHPEPPERITVGRRDALLVELRERTFGAGLEAVVACPACAEELEIELSVGDLPGPGPAAGERWELELEGVRLGFRLPTAADLLALAGAADAEEGARILCELCLVDPPDELTPELGEAVAARMADEDPGARIELELRCLGCEHEWSAPFDIVSFLWAEIEARARRLLNEVHSLASAYGWDEREILALGPARRETYLELVGR